MIRSTRFDTEKYEISHTPKYYWGAYAHYTLCAYATDKGRRTDHGKCDRLCVPTMRHARDAACIGKLGPQNGYSETVTYAVKQNTSRIYS